jgi:hypothetical protein
VDATIAPIAPPERSEGCASVKARAAASTAGSDGIRARRGERQHCGAVRELQPACGRALKQDCLATARSSAPSCGPPRYLRSMGCAVRPPLATIMPNSSWARATTRSSRKARYRRSQLTRWRQGTLQSGPVVGLFALIRPSRVATAFSSPRECPRAPDRSAERSLRLVSAPTSAAPPADRRRLPH